MLKTLKSNAFEVQTPPKTSQISLSIKKYKSYAIASIIHSSKSKRQINTYNNQMRPRTPPMLQSFEVPIPQDPLCNLKAIRSLGTSFAWWAHNLLEVNRARDEIAQAYTHTQMHMNNVWSEMVSCSPFFCLFIVFLHFFGSYKQYGITHIPLPTSVVALFLLFHMPLSFHFYWLWAI